MATIKVTDDNFEDVVLKSDLPIVVDFWAEWCGPCKMIAPTLEELAEENADVYAIGKINVDENRTYAMRYGVRGIPTMIVFKDGEVVETIVGALPKDALSAKISASI